MIELCLLILFAVVVAISAVVGLVRGLNKAVIRLITLVLAALLTFALAGPITKVTVQTIQIEGLTLREWILAGLGESEMLAGIFNAVPLMLETILAVPAFILGIVIFPVVFWLLSGASWIVFLFVQKPLRRWIFQEKGDQGGMHIGKRFAGMGVGIVTGALIFGVFLSPVLGLFTVLPQKSAMDEVLDAVVEQDILTATDAAFVQDAYAVTDCAIVKIYRVIGASSVGRAYINAVSAIEADGMKTSLADEFASLLAAGQTAIKGGLVNALSSEDPDAIYNILSDKTFMDALMQDMFGSKLLRAAVPEVVAVAVEGAASNMGVPANKDAVYNNMMDDIALAVKNTEIDYAAIQAYEQAHGVAYRLARTSAAERTGNSGIMTDEEYAAEIQKLDKLAETIAAILNRAISGDHAVFAESVAGCIVHAVKAQAAGEGQDVLSNFDAASVKDTLSGLDSANLDAGEADAGELLAQLTDQEQFETDMATVETIKEAIRESVKNAVADDSQAAQTASTLASVVSDLVGAVSGTTDENGGMNAAKLDFEKVASAVTSLQNSTLKDVGSSVLDMVASSELGENSLVSNMLGVVKEGYENGEDIGGTINIAGALINLGAAMSGGGEGGQEAMVESLTDLINNLNEFTIDLLPSILSKETITSMGIPKEYASSTYGVIDTLLRELMKLKGAEDYDNEVNTILSLYNLATNGVEQFKKEDVKGLAGYALQSDAIFNTLISISESNPFGIQIQDEATRAELVNAIEDYYAQSGQTQRERDIYHAVATLLGLDGEVDLS